MKKMHSIASTAAIAVLAGFAFAAAPASAEQAKKPAATPAATAAQYKTEAEAKSHCATDVVVWVNTSTKVYHYAGNAEYGKTKRGGYACEKEAGTGGFHAAKNEKRPG
ncbi:MAG: hypothetical protein WAN43_19855 [Rhodomicrobium sp.]|jgi:hypothetical protein